MTRLHEQYLTKIWRDKSPYKDFPLNSYEKDLQGWGSDHHYLTSSITTLKPAVAVEIGVWKGRSSINIAKTMKAQKLDGVLFCVDTWLGSSEHWINDQYFKQLVHVDGYPTLYKQFIKNVMSCNVDDYIIPLPLDSINASVLIRRLGLKADFIHLDAGHDFRSVTADLQEWWPLLKDGGELIGDDYYEESHWPEVQQAFMAFFSPRGLNRIENQSGKCRIIKHPNMELQA
jgi:hypothetical protein